jgi:hypothetical protein
MMSWSGSLNGSTNSASNERAEKMLRIRRLWVTHDTKIRELEKEDAA